MAPHRTSCRPSLPRLGAGRTAKSLSVGAFHVCVVLDDGGVKCWGSNTSGQLAVGSVATIGDSANQATCWKFRSVRRRSKRVRGANTPALSLEDRSVVSGARTKKANFGNTDSVGNAPGFTLKAVDLTF